MVSTAAEPAADVPPAISHPTRIVSWPVVAMFVLLTLAFTYPLWLDLGGSVMWSGSDTELFAWTLAWDGHAFAHSPWAIFDANIFYPFAHTLAYSENLIGSAFFAAPVLWITGNPVAAINVVTLLSCFLCGLGTYILARRLGLGTAAAVIAGVIFAFSPPRFMRIGQLHLCAVQWIPFGLASLHAYFDEGRARHLRWAVAFFTLEVLSSGHGAVYLLVGMAGLTVYRLVLGEPVKWRQRLDDFGLPGFLLLVPAILVVLQYQYVQREVGLVRTLADWTRTNGASFLTSPSHVDVFIHNRLPGRLDPAQGDLFPGYLPFLFALLAFLPRRGPKPGSTTLSHVAGAFEVVASLGLTCGVVMLFTGPIRFKVNDFLLLSLRQVARPWILFAACAAVRVVLSRWVPLEIGTRLRHLRDWLTEWPRRDRTNAMPFYLLLAIVTAWVSFPLDPPWALWPHIYWLPGLNFIRVPARFTLLSLMALGVVVGYGYERASKWLRPSWRTAAGVVMAVLLLVEFASMPLQPNKWSIEIPDVDRWVATLPGSFAIAEVPTTDPDGETWRWEQRQAIYMLHSMAHWQRTIHAFSGTRPELLDDTINLLGRFPDEKSVRRLEFLGIKYLIVHTDYYEPGQWEKVEKQIEAFGDRLRLEKVVGAGRVYSVH